MTTAKEYLSRLRNLDLMIQQKQIEVDELRSLANSTGGGADGELVKSSKTGDTLEKRILKYVDLEREINDDIDTLVHLRHSIMDEIHELTNSKHIEILFKRYVEYKHFEKISVEMNYSYDRVRHCHIEALEAFQEEILSRHTIAHKDVV